MSPKQAAEIIGCSISTIREAIVSGKLLADKRETTTNRAGFVYHIADKSLADFSKIPRTESRGWVRGRKRNPK